MERLSEFKRWLDRLEEEGWLSPTQREELLQRLQEPKELPPPLLVAFFGGTGVGKSTLLNRLAGGEIAQASPLRPTSREVTLYLHRDLPSPPFPGRVVRHALDKFSQIVWIDTPDLDSVEPENREQALRVLPLVDVVVYVVDPERYRDDVGWRLLLEESGRHGWLFVMSHWDSGCELQIEDFRRLLKEAGFEDPLILRCDNRPELDRRKPDDFAKLEQLLRELAEAKGQEAIRERREAARMREAAALLERLSFGSPEAWEQLQAFWQELCDRLREELLPLIEGFAQTGSHFRRGEGGWFLDPIRLALDRLEVEAAALGLPTRPLLRPLSEIRERLPEESERTVRREVALALRRPRDLRGLAAGLFERFRFGLPLLASCWIGYQVVVKYYQGFFEERLYLGDEFAIHSTMLLLLSWLLPELAWRLLRPSQEARRRLGLERGLRRALSRLEAEVASSLEALREEAERLEREREALAARLDRPPEKAPSLPYLSRMVPGRAAA